MQQEKELTAQKPFWDKALRAVKGDSTNALVEDFTSEMTLVAEGLYEDQNRLRTSLEDLSARQDRGQEKLSAQLDALERSLSDTQRETDTRLEDLSRRLAALEKADAKAGAKEGRHRLFSRDNGSLMHQITVLVGIVAGSWVLVTLLNLVKSTL